jgi:hypothetical protein
MMTHVSDDEVERWRALKVVLEARLIMPRPTTQTSSSKCADEDE